MRILTLLISSLFFVFTCVFNSAKAQNSNLLIQSQQTVQWYVENVLLGAGVAADNITFNGQPADQVHLQCGYFQSNGSYVELESGLVLSTGNVVGTNFAGDSVIVGQATSISTGAAGVDGDADLESITGQAINDIAILEFDFIPTGDTLRFNYIFGSEEYPEYVNTNFNDLFGFFLSGPGITGPFSSPAGFPGGATNIALVPGTTTPVAISNVNNGQYNCPSAPTGPCTNCAYFVDNCAIADSALDGTTTVLEAFSLVNCGETYHIKLAIGDAADGSFDSAVFLQEGSFESSLAISAGLFSSIGPNLNGILYENCGFGTLTFNRSAGIDQEALVELELSGTGVNGVDFTTIPPSFVFGIGDSVLTMNVSALIDNIDEGLEDVTLTITNTAVSACSGNITSSFTFFISDDPEPLLAESVDYDIDCGDTIVIATNVSGGYGQYNYSWSPALPNQPDPIVSPGFTTDYYVVISDTCNSISTLDTITVTVPVYPPVNTDLIDIVDLDCLEDITLMPDLVDGGNGVFTYEWYENGDLVGTDFTLFYTGGVSSNLTFVATDGCGTQSIEELAVLVDEIPLIVTASNDTTICADSTVPLSVEVSGGEPPYELSWSLSGFNDYSMTVSPIESSQYYISVTDLCGNVVTDDVNVRVADSRAFFSMASFGYYGIELTNFSTTDNADSLFYLWDFGDGNLSEEESPRHTFTDLDEHDVWLVVSNEYGCKDSMFVTSDPPATIYVPSSFSPNGDGLNDHFFVTANELVDYELFIYDRWGRQVFHSVDQSEKWNGRAAQESEFFGQNQVFLYRLRTRTEKGERYDMHGTITMVR